MTGPVVRTHLVDANGDLLCPEAELRDAMSDGQFWDHAFNGGQEPDDWEPDDDELGELYRDGVLGAPCSECGQVGACAYDAEGRVLIHVTEDGD